MNCIYCEAELIQHDDKAFCTNCGDVPTDKHREDIKKYCYNGSARMTQEEMVKAFRRFYLLPIGLSFDGNNPEHREELKRHEEYMFEEMQEFTVAHATENKPEMLDAYIDLLYFYIGCEVHLGCDVLEYIHIYWNASVSMYNLILNDYTEEDIDNHFINVHVANMNKSETIGDVDYPIFQYLNPTDYPDKYAEFKIDFRQGRTQKWVNQTKGKLLKGNNFTQPIFNISSC